ncbi:hypothetical protein [Aestuariicoccus sp. MJ-SS9]|uniref:hypothetical protein n=1 Tax=Aestuariicoccus sp. MJ-SS9 TaxID=3079855 RepID=UPI002915AA8C|nr:hypothetical protein [Aestuariicoccus sp. MJ-SS9]MDU8914029.1 hypothetical protein [Aestuariicoccus sp. MJ-SS9]
MLATEIAEAGWYSGAAGQNMQGILRAFFAEIRTRLNVRRRVYVGASSGGFAALLYSHADPGSIAVSAILQIVLRNHYRVSVNRYRHECWRDCATIPDMDDKANFDLAALYGKGFENNVIYVQSGGDRFHMINHLAPFLAVMDEEAMSRVVFDIGFWGKLGHSGATPTPAFLPWVEAALTSEEMTADALLETRFDLLKRDMKSSRIAAPETVTPPAPGPSADDLRLNRPVRDYLLLATDRKEPV